jgi:hypothetical protein
MVVVDAEISKICNALEVLFKAILKYFILCLPSCFPVVLSLYFIFALKPKMKNKDK